MGLLGLWMVAGLLLASAVAFSWVTITTRPLAADLARRGEPRRHDDLVRRASAHLDEEYRRLLQP